MPVLEVLGANHSMSAQQLEAIACCTLQLGLVQGTMQLVCGPLIYLPSPESRRDLPGRGFAGAGATRFSYRMLTFFLNAAVRRTLSDACGFGFSHVQG